MSKQKKSKLDQFADTLVSMEMEKKTLVEMQAWLKEEGVTISMGRLSEYLDARRRWSMQQQLLGQIASGARQCEEVEKQFGKNPAPQLETLIKLHRVLILQMSTQGTANPEFLKLADQMLRTAMDYISNQTKASQKERELIVSEGKFELEKKKADAYDRAQAAIAEAKNSKGGITAETFTKIERELKLL